jgi:hypothetical protein
MRTSVVNKNTIDGVPAARYAARFKAERAKLRRAYCTVFKFWRSCGFKPCAKARACKGDAKACLKRGETTIPRDRQWAARQKILAATPQSAGPPERAARECLPGELCR